PALQSVRIHSQQARFLRPIQVEATRVISIAHTKLDERNSFQIGRVKAVKITPRLAVQSIRDRQGGFAQQCEPASARGSPGSIRGCVQSERADGGDQKYAAGEQANGGEAAFAPARAAAQAQTTQSELVFRSFAAGGRA